MRIKPFISFLDQLSVKPFFTNTRFVASHKQNRLALGIKGKSDPPYTVFGLKAKLLHVGMARSLKGVHPRAAYFGSEHLKKFRLCEQLVLHLNGQVIEFSIKGQIEIDFLLHGINML